MTPKSHPDALELVRPLSMFEQIRWDALNQVVAEFESHRVPGCLAVFGVARGGIPAYLAMRFPDRPVYGYCAFDRGLTGCGGNDGGLRDGLCADSPVDVVRGWMADLGLSNVQLVSGDVRLTLPAEHEPVGLAVIDLDIYEPTLHVLEWLKRHSVPSCRVLVDDQDWSGVQAARVGSGLTWELMGFMAKAVLTL